MQIIKRTTLLYQAGSSAKVYEIDLCQIGDNRYVVNSRYGKQDTVLKEKSETVTAVSLEQAQKLCDRLVNAKVSKGYRDATGEAAAISTPIASSPPPPIEISIDSDARIQAILNRLVAILNLGVPTGVATRQVSSRASSRRSSRVSRRSSTTSAAEENRQQPLDRLIWRVGELKIASAAPLLLRMLNTSHNPIRNYAIAWSLGWCGDRSVIPTLEDLYQNIATPDSVRRIAFEAVFKLADSAKQAEMRSQLIGQLPIALQDPVRHGTAEQFSEALQVLLNSEDRYRFMAIELLYQINSENIRPAILDVLRTIPLRYNYFQRVRHIFKIAEYRQDAEAFAILTRRFDTNNPAPQISSYRDQRTREIMIFVEEEGVTKEFPLREHPEYEAALTSQVYTDKTRSYLRRRVWRSLRKLGELGDPAYINLAVSILLQYSDTDAEEVRQSVYYKYDRNWRRYESARIEWDIYAKYLTFNHILYEHSPRYDLKPNSKAWRCVPPYKPEHPEPKVREEAFPQLWEQHPTALLQLLLESEARPVHHFAVKAMRSCQQFCAELSLENLIKILARPYEVTAQLGFELARSRYQPEQPDGKLILALANCAFAPARTEAYRWINEQRDRFLAQDSQLIAGLVLSKQAETRTFARQLLGSATVSDATVRSLIGQIIALMLTLQPDQVEQAKQGAETLLLSFSMQLRSLGLEIILDLLRHPLPELQTLGAQILVNHKVNALDLPSGLIEALLESPYDNVQVLGVRLFGQLPDRVLLERTALILTIATHAIADMREAIRPIIRRLANDNHGFSLILAGQLLQIW
jgi:predicted DNA-binding WGR domain protein